MRFYDKRELKTLFARHGLTLVRHLYYNEKGDRYARKSLLRRAALALKWPFMLIPHYRNGHFAVFKKN